MPCPEHGAPAVHSRQSRAVWPVHGLSDCMAMTHRTRLLSAPHTDFQMSQIWAARRPYQLMRLVKAESVVLHIARPCCWTQLPWTENGQAPFHTSLEYST